MTIDVSIIIPLYNKVEVIRQTLNSVLKQSYTNWECIIVDDGSKDASVDVVEAFIAEHPGNWRLLRQANQGQAKTRNNGIDQASGEFLAFLDADDLWPPDKISSQVAALRRNPHVVCVLSSYAIFGKNRLRIVRHASPNVLLTRWLDMSGFGGGLESVGLVRKSAISKFGGFDTNFSTSSGLDLTLRLSKKGEIVVLKEIGLYYRLAEGQWHTDLKELIRNLSLIQEKYSDLYRGDLSTSHSAYIFWALTRQKGLQRLLLEFLKSLLHPRNGRAQMLIQLAERNLKSVLLGQLEGQRLRNMLSILNPKEST